MNKDKTIKFNWYAILIGLAILIGWLMWMCYILGNFDSEPEVIDLLTSTTPSYVVAPTMLSYQYAIKTITTTITAYSSTVDQCDSTPFTTASGTQVRDGIVACNFLAFGTKIRFPEMYGNKIFVVEDRMALRNSHKIDIWFQTRKESIDFGTKVLKVEIVGMQIAMQ